MCICVYSVYSDRVREKHRGIARLPQLSYFVLSAIFVYIFCVSYMCKSVHYCVYFVYSDQVREKRQGIGRLPKLNNLYSILT